MKQPSALLAGLLAAVWPASADVTISEIGAASSDRLLQWSDAGMPRVGAGTPWWDAGFDDGSWPSGPAPLGFGNASVTTDVAADMQGATPSLYVRKTFTVSAADASLGTDLVLDVDYDDGFIAYVNGKEVGRCNMGATHGFVYADQPSYNEGDSGGAPESFNIGPVSGCLVAGQNILAIQTHNESLGSNDLLIEARLSTTGGGGTDFVDNGETWNYFVGHVEPSGGVFDPAFLPGASQLVVEWAKAGFDDNAWPSGAAPIGYDANPHYPLGTNLIQMRNNQTSVYTRRSFTLNAGELAAIGSLTLTVDYDDGYVAYLNGTEIARGNMGATGSVVPFSATSNGGHNASMDSGGNNQSVIETIPVSASLLVEGENVFAAQIHNSSSGSSDLILINTLDANTGTLVNSSDTVKYFIGTSEPAPPPGESEEVPEAKFVDWIELHNNGGAPVDLGGWSLTDDASDTRKFVIPAGTTIPAGGYLLVLADDQAQANGASSFVHSNFKLDSDGEYVGLFDGSNVLQSEIAPAYPDQYPFTSYGLDSGTSGYMYLDPPTPGAANAGAASLTDRAKAPDFSLAGGFYANNLLLTLSSVDPGATIRYTMDGSDPTLTNGSTYNSALSLTQVDNKTGRVVRARSYVPGMIPSKVRTHTYLINQHANLRAAPALIFSGDPERSFFKPHGIMSIEGGVYVSSRWQANGKDSYNVPINRGIQYERPMYMELYYDDGRPGIRERAGVRLSSSNFSRPRLRLDDTSSSPWPSSGTQKPSFNVYFRNDYGSPAIDYPWVSDDYSITRFEQLRIRAGKNDIRNPWIKDEIMRRLYAAMGQESSTGTTNTLYINGSFKGYFNMTERLREPFFQAHHGGNKEWDVRQVGDFANGDRVAWDQMFALSNQNLAVQANYDALAEMLDIENLIDYLLVNIYGATWDWPNNNWVGARERSPTGKWRFYVWDAEGAFAHSGSKPIGFDTIQNDLINRSNEIPRLYQRLSASEEFRLHFADRIHKHFFHGGVLDDRNASTSTFKTLKDELVAGFQPLLSFVHNQTVNQGFFNNWTNPSSGHRTYLFGPNDNHFRDHGLWPDTEPPALNQHGGEVSAGFNLTMSHTAPGGSTIYYTLDGTDPRLPGGAISGTALTYSGGISLNNAFVEVMARVRSSTGEWSALTETDFLVGTVPASASNLVVAELMYHPADVSVAEANAGFSDKDDFEYIRLMNVDTVPVDLSTVHFVDGISFDFAGDADILAIDPGTSVLLVKNRAAFNARYGSQYDSIIAGEYSSQLSNGGERLQIDASPGVLLREFTYDDSGDWPRAADGFGGPLLLVNPFALPDHDLAASWMASAQFGGTPGGGAAPPVTFTDWQNFHFDATELADPLISGPNADPDGNGFSNIVDYGLAIPPRFGVSDNAFKGGMEIVGNEEYLAVEFRILESASDISFSVEVSDDMTIWDGSPAATVLVFGPVDNGDGTVSYRYRDSVPRSTGKRRFIQIAISADS